MASFFENLRNVTSRINTAGKSNYGETDLPNIKYGFNTASWRDRQAVPFSYQTSEKGDRQYGIMYIPFYEKEKISKNGGVKSEDIETYGAELIDGQSYDTDGFRKLYDKIKNADFRVEGSGMVKVDDADKFKSLRNSLKIRQGERSPVRDFYQNIRSVNGKGIGL